MSADIANAVGEILESLQGPDDYKETDGRPRFAKTVRGTKIHIINPLGEMKLYLGQHQHPNYVMALVGYKGTTYCGIDIKDSSGDRLVPQPGDETTICSNCARLFVV